MVEERRQALLTPYKLGDLELSNRAAMASMTRQRCDKATGIPNDLLVEYYSARASAGLIFTEAVAPSVDGNGCPGSAGINTDE